MMCNWGNYIQLNVPIPAELSYTGEARWWRGNDHIHAG